jgi:hypothetical protein
LGVPPLGGEAREYTLTGEDRGPGRLKAELHTIYNSTDGFNRTKFESPLARVRLHWQDPSHMRERLQAWTEGVETFVIDVLLRQRRGKWAALMRGGLLFLSRIFSLAVKARRALHDRHR